MSVLNQINNYYNSLTKAEKKVADFIQKNPDKVIIMSLQELAHKCDTSDATVLRLCRSLDYSGYTDLKGELIPELLKKGVPVYQEQGEDQDQLFSDKFDFFLNSITQDVKNTFDNIDKEKIEKIADIIKNKDKIIIIGEAGSAGVGKVLADSLIHLGKQAIYLKEELEIIGMTDFSQEKVLLFAISHSGETENTCSIVNRAKAKDIDTCALTNSASSRLHSLVDYCLLTSVAENLLSSYSCIPRITQLALLEILISYLAENLD